MTVAPTLCCLLVRRYLKSLRKIGEVLVASATSFAAIAALLLLFWVVFSIVGLHVFGGTPLDSDWPNFDTLINSMVTIFNTLNLENLQVGGQGGRGGCSLTAAMASWCWGCQMTEAVSGPAAQAILWQCTHCQRLLRA